MHLLRMPYFQNVLWGVVTNPRVQHPELGAPAGWEALILQITPELGDFLVWFLVAHLHQNSLQNFGEFCLTPNLIPAFLQWNWAFSTPPKALEIILVTVNCCFILSVAILLRNPTNRLSQFQMCNGDRITTHPVRQLLSGVCGTPLALMAVLT